MEDMEAHRAVRAIFEFVDDLSNWYLRRSRRRFWSDEDQADKLAANSTLYKTLKDMSRLMAPFAPFVAEAMYQNLVAGKVPGSRESVHLDSFPVYRPEATDNALEDEMRMVQAIAEAGRNARQTSGVRLRQPLSRAVVVTKENIAHPTEDIQILMDELNVKAMEMVPEASEAVSGMATAEGKGFTVYIDMHITPELESEGMARDIVRRIQSLRKDMDLQYDRNVKMGIEGIPKCCKPWMNTGITSRGRRLPPRLWPVRFRAARWGNGISWERS